MQQSGTRARKVPRASKRLENELYRQGFRTIAGLDEVGRGAWAGPVVAAAVVLPLSVKIGAVYDSKSLTPERREELRIAITKIAVTYAIGQASVEEINSVGVTGALRLAYVRALKQLNPQPDVVILDGLPLRDFPYRHRALVDADQKSKCVAAASIIAKQHRDGLMKKIAPRYPNYLFEQNKGYGTEQHQHAILKNGVLEIHRTNYGWIRDWQNGKRPTTAAAKKYFAKLS